MNTSSSSLLPLVLVAALSSRRPRSRAPGRSPGAGPRRVRRRRRWRGRRRRRSRPTPTASSSDGCSSSRFGCRAAHAKPRCERRSRRTSPCRRTPLPHDGDTRQGRRQRARRGTRSTRVNYNVNLYHFAYALNKPTTNVLFWAVTVVNSPREMRGVRLAIGSNAASVWWVNGEEATALYNDRQTVIDDGVSKRLTLKQGRERDSRRDRQRRRGDGFLRAVSRRERSADQDADRSQRLVRRLQ